MVVVPCCPSDLVVARTPTRRQASGGGPPPQIPRRTRQPRTTAYASSCTAVGSNGRLIRLRQCGPAHPSWSRRARKAPRQPRAAAVFLRLPSRALGALEDLEPD